MNYICGKIKLSGLLLLPLLVNPCASNPCQNGGRCIVTGNDSNSCQCTVGYYGDICEKGTCKATLYLRKHL